MATFSGFERLALQRTKTYENLAEASVYSDEDTKNDEDFVDEARDDDRELALLDHLSTCTTRVLTYKHKISSGILELIQRHRKSLIRALIKHQFAKSFQLHEIEQLSLGWIRGWYPDFEDSYGEILFSRPRGKARVQTLQSCDYKSAEI